MSCVCVCPRSPVKGGVNPTLFISGQDALLCLNLLDRGILNQLKRQWDYRGKGLGSAARAHQYDDSDDDLIVTDQTHLLNSFDCPFQVSYVTCQCVVLTRRCELQLTPWTTGVKHPHHCVLLLLLSPSSHYGRLDQLRHLLFSRRN